MLPSIIEYLLARSDLEESWGILDDTIQAVIANVPPLNIIRYSISPVSYMHIIYDISFGLAIVPNALSVKMTTGRGSELIDTIITGRFCPVTTFGVITPSSSLHVEITNNTGLVQYYEATHYYIDIPNPEVYHEIVKILHQLLIEKNSEGAQQLLGRLR